MGRKRNLAAEGAKFTAVNVLATAVALVGFNLLVHGVYGWFDGPMNHRPLSAYVVANSVGMVISFLGIRHYVYRHRKPMGPGGGFVNYAAVNLASFVLPVGCLWFTRNVLDWNSAIADNVSGNIVGSVLATAFRFWAFRRYVFKVEPPTFTRPLSPSPYLTAWHHGPVGEGSHPEVGPHESEFVEHQPKHRKAYPHHVVRVPGDALHEGPAASVEGEAAGDAERLP